MADNEGWGANLDSPRIMTIIKREYARLAFEKSGQGLYMSCEEIEKHPFYLRGEIFANSVVISKEKFTDLFKLNLDDYSDKHILPDVMANADIELSPDYKETVVRYA